jgi:tetratricopeptide (TPR) repeat protein
MRLLKEVRNLMGNYHVKSGMYHYYRTEYSQAVEFLRKALKDEKNLSEADRRNARHYLTLALMDSAARLEAKDELDAGVEQLRRAAEVSPRFPDIHYRLGRLLERMERHAEAVEEYGKAIESNENYLDARVALGFCLLRSGRPTDAAEAFRGAMKVKTRKIEAPCLDGIAALERGESSVAEDCLHEAFLALPRLSQLFLQKALELLADEDYEKALPQLDRALELNPKYPDLHNFRGVALCELDRIDEAIASFRQSAALNPDYVVPRLNLAFAMLRAGRYKEAEVELESILDVDPSEPAAIAQLEELRSGRVPEKRRPVSRGSAR